MRSQGSRVTVDQSRNIFRRQDGIKHIEYYYIEHKDLDRWGWCVIQKIKTIITLIYDKGVICCDFISLESGLEVTFFNIRRRPVEFCQFFSHFPNGYNDKEKLTFSLRLTFDIFSLRSVADAYYFMTDRNVRHNTDLCCRFTYKWVNGKSIPTLSQV